MRRQHRRISEPSYKALMLRRLVNKIQKFRERNTDPKIDELLESARLDLANAVNLMNAKVNQRVVKKQKIIMLLNKDLPVKIIALKSDVTIERVYQIKRELNKNELHL